MTPVFRRLVPLCLAGALVACGGGADPDTRAAQPAPTAAVEAPAATSAPTDGTDAPAPTGAVPAALDFSAPLVGGGSIELGASAGRPVLLWFWAPW